MAAKTVFYFIGILLFVGIQAQVSIVYDVFSNSKINTSALIEITGSVTINWNVLWNNAFNYFQNVVLECTQWKQSYQVLFYV